MPTFRAEYKVGLQDTLAKERVIGSGQTMLPPEALKVPLSVAALVHLGEAIRAGGAESVVEPLGTEEEEDDKSEQSDGESTQPSMSMTSSQVTTQATHSPPRQNVIFIKDKLRQVE